jgi:Tfp pilus assembly PilM family ATPase
MTTKKELRYDFKIRMRSARGPLIESMRRIDRAADQDDVEQGIEALKRARLAVKIMKIALKRRLEQ